MESSEKLLGRTVFGKTLHFRIWSLKKTRFLAVLIIIMLALGTLLIWQYQKGKRAQYCKLVSAAIMAMDRSPPTRIIEDKQLQHEICDLMVCPISRDVLAMTLRLRLYKKTMSAFETQQWKEFDPFQEKLLTSLQKSLFFWTNTLFIGVLRRENGIDRKGIVITTGMKTFAMTVHLIQSIRKVYKSDLPIEIFYNGAKDLTSSAIKLLDRLPKVKALDLNTIFSLSGQQLNGWDLKPFAMLASSFQQVMLLDADVVLMQSPDIFFTLPQFEQNGALFFRDRIMALRAFDYPKWFNGIIPPPHRETLRATEMYQGKTTYQQESGSVIIDKSRGLFGLLAACLLNLPGPKQILHQGTHGEKEAYWIGFEIAEEPYEFYAGRNGAIGLAKMPNELSGKIAHFDTQDQLLWFNDGILENKHIPNSKIANLQQVAFDGKWHYLTMINTTVHRIDPLGAKKLQSIQKLWISNPLSVPINTFD